MLHCPINEFVPFGLPYRSFNSISFVYFPSDSSFSWIFLQFSRSWTWFVHFVYFTLLNFTGNDVESKYEVILVIYFWFWLLLNHLLTSKVMLNCDIKCWGLWVMAGSSAALHWDLLLLQGLFCLSYLMILTHSNLSSAVALMSPWQTGNINMKNIWRK